MYDNEELMEVAGSLLAMQHTIYQATLLRPTMMMLPHHAVPEGSIIYGLPVMSGDRAALIYEPPKPQRGRE